MEIVIRAEDFLPTDSLRAHVVRGLRAVGRGMRSQIRCVHVMLIPGTRTGGSGGCSGPKTCKLVADVVGVGQVEVDEQDHDLYRAVGRATTRLSRRLSACRALDRFWGGISRSDG